MSGKDILVLDQKGSPWVDFFQEFFEETASRVHLFQGSREAGEFLVKNKPALAFVRSELSSLALNQKLKILQTEHPGFRLFQIGASKPGLKADLEFQDSFAEPTEFPDFQKQLVRHLPLPERIDLLIVDDEPSIKNMMEDFVHDRMHPSIQIRYASNGVEGLEKIAAKKPDVVLLDIKMPLKDGREVYREIVKQKMEIPVVIFFDAVSGDEMRQIRQIGKPAVVEKCSMQSALPEMVELLKKMVYFG